MSEALKVAHKEDLDLVEVAPNANPPVVKMMNYGKFKYKQEKQAREARKSQKRTEVKEIRLRPKTSEHHRNIKVRQARGWLKDGMKVKVRIRFRGREITYPEIAIEQLREIAEKLSDVAIVEQKPNREGRTMLMFLSPEENK